MSTKEPSIKVPVDLTNPGQFFACCGLLELASRLWPDAEGWFDAGLFCIATDSDGTLASLLDSVCKSIVSNAMTPQQHARLEQLASLGKMQRAETPGLEDEMKRLESLRRETPILLKGQTTFRIDWFFDDEAGGSRFKNWAGRQSVLDIATAMHAGCRSVGIESEATLWNDARGIGLPFNFDSDLGGQGSCLDIGFSFDALDGSETTRIEGTCRPRWSFYALSGFNDSGPAK